MKEWPDGRPSTQRISFRAFLCNEHADENKRPPFIHQTPAAPVEVLVSQAQRETVFDLLVELVKLFQVQVLDNYEEAVVDLLSLSRLVDSTSLAAGTSHFGGGNCQVNECATVNAVQAGLIIGSSLCAGEQS